MPEEIYRADSAEAALEIARTYPDKHAEYLESISATPIDGSRSTAWLIERVYSVTPPALGK